jgi:transcriptional regulator of acetoin/glycerol metabolism
MTAAPLTPEAARKAAAEDERLIKAALRIARGNVTVAATLLDVPTRTLHRRITALGLRAWLTERYPRSVRQPKR